MVQEYTMYSFSRTDFGDAAAGGQKLLMRLHRPIFAPSFFPPQNRASAHARCWIKIPFFHHARTQQSIVLRYAFETASADAASDALTIESL